MRSLSFLLTLTSFLTATNAWAHTGGSQNFREPTMQRLLGKAVAREKRCELSGAHYPEEGDQCLAEMQVARSKGRPVFSAFEYDPSGRLYCVMPGGGISCR